MKYTTIIYQVKKELELNFLEYILLDIVNIIQNAPQNQTPGWSSASRSYYGEVLGISERQVRRYVERLIEKNLLERNKSNQLRTTQEWVNAAYIGNTEQPGQNVRAENPEEQDGKVIRTYHKNKVLFKHADVYDWEIFKTFFEAEEYKNIDIYYYYQQMKQWSESKGQKRNNWIEQCHVLMSRAADQNRLKTISGTKAKDKILSNFNEI